MNIVFNGVLAYYFYQYAFNNPDDGSCWAIAGNNVPSATEQAGYKNVTEQFVTWFYWGFIINVGAMVVAVFRLLYAATESEAWIKLANFIGGPLGCGGLAWFIAGLVLRYRDIGNTCSGDYVTADDASVDRSLYSWDSGHFINIYYTVIMWFFIVVCSCVCCIGICAGVMSATQ